jgi:cholesterol transport system auxiliary component
MNTIKNIANNASSTGTSGLFGLKWALLASLVALVSACSVLPAPPAKPVLYDFGPGAVAAPASDRRAPLRPMGLADVTQPGLAEGNTAVLYRLAYADAQQLRPYTLARWTQPPAQLVQQRLREQLGGRRAVLPADDALAQSRKAPAGQAARQPWQVLRVELEEFSQVFTSATDSVGVVRARATVVDLTPSGEVLRGQTVFAVRTAARSADAAGGVDALALAATQMATELDQWLLQMQ